MIVRVYFYKETNPEIILGSSKLSRQALFTIYELVWEVEFKNILNPGRVWIKFLEEVNPFGVPLKYKRHHSKITMGDIIQIAEDFYIVLDVGVKKITMIDPS
jgi:hypothetical protein